MSEDKPGWASLSTVADMLTTADNVSRISFYTTKRDNSHSPTELNCRIFGFPALSKQDIEDLTQQLNEAIGPVLQKVQDGLSSKAANQLRRFL